MAATAEPKPHLWTRDDYYRMAELGFFDGVRVELIEGQVIEMPPMFSPHATSVTLVGDALRAVGPLWSGGPHFPRVQLPLSLGQISDPEPDAAVVPGHPRDYKDAHPTMAVLVVGVAETSLRYDRTQKASLYARAGIRDYWIVNLPDRRLEVYRDPHPDAGQPFRFGYATAQTFGEQGAASPLAASGAAIPVADLLP